jgi:hypothetical protein
VPQTLLNLSATSFYWWSPWRHIPKDLIIDVNKMEAVPTCRCKQHRPMFLNIRITDFLKKNVFLFGSFLLKICNNIASALYIFVLMYISTWNSVEEGICLQILYELVSSWKAPGLWVMLSWCEWSKRHEFSHVFRINVRNLSTCSEVPKLRLRQYLTFC